MKFRRCSFFSLCALLFLFPESSRLDWHRKGESALERGPRLRVDIHSPVLRRGIGDPGRSSSERRQSATRASSSCSSYRGRGRRTSGRCTHAPAAREAAHQHAQEGQHPCAPVGYARQVAQGEVSIFYFLFLLALVS